MDISVIIVNFNSGELILECIGSLYDTTVDIAIEVIVVDNASMDGSVERIQKKFPQANIIQNKNNLYYSAANNQGIQVAQGTTILILNPDTRIGKGAVKQLYTSISNERSLGAVTGRMHFPDDRIQKNCSKFPKYRHLIAAYTLIGGLAAPIRNRWTDDYFYGNWDRRSSRDVEVIPGSIMMIRKNVLNQTGPFDSRMKMYFSDDDLCRRIAQCGYRLRYVPNATFLHYEQHSVKQVCPETVNALYRKDLLTFTRKHYGDFPAAVLGGLIHLTGVAHRIRSRRV